MPAENVWKNPADMDPAIASIQEPLGNAVHTVLESQNAGGTTAIIGCGPIGLMAVAVAKQQVQRRWSPLTKMSTD